jgi:hypothetical protein
MSPKTRGDPTLKEGTVRRAGIVILFSESPEPGNQGRVVRLSQGEPPAVDRVRVMISCPARTGGLSPVRSGRQRRTGNERMTDIFPGKDGRRMHIKSRPMRESLMDKGLIASTDDDDVIWVLPDVNVVAIGGRSILDRGKQALVPLLDELVPVAEAGGGGTDRGRA